MFNPSILNSNLSSTDEQTQREIQWIIKDKYDGNPTISELDKDIERLKDGEPVDYIIGFKNFLHCKIDLSHHPLIPREETEYWTENILNSEFRIQDSELRILDIFSGSGCIGTAVLKHVPTATVDFAEKETDLINQIKKNLQINNLAKEKDRYRIIKSDLFENISNKYHYILANPPYVEEDDMDKLQKSVYDHEPHEALFGGPDGLDIVRKFLNDAKNYLVPGGKIFMEFGEGQKDSIEKIAIVEKYKSIKFQKDQCGKWRILEIRN